jgi:hypothetical protein
MPECHKCPYNGTGSNECLKCAGPSEELNHHGSVHVSADVLEHGAKALRPEPSPLDTPPEVWAFAHRLLKMTSRQRDVYILHISHPELSLAEIGRRTGTKQWAVSRALERARVALSAIGRHEHCHGRPHSQADRRRRIRN